MVDPLYTSGGRRRATPVTRQVFVGKRAALARAIAATPAQECGVRVWRYADAIFTGGRWVCVLEDDTAVYVVNVQPHTGASPVIVRRTPG